MSGINTSLVEVVNISTRGFWIFLNNEELYLSFENFPWFENTTISELTKVEQPREGHLYWPSLDIDLSVESIRNPRNFPLISK